MKKNGAWTTCRGRKKSEPFDVGFVPPKRFGAEFDGEGLLGKENTFVLTIGTFTGNNEYIFFS